MKKYIHVFKNVRIPWLLLLVLGGFLTLEAQVSVKTVRLTADIIDSTRQTIELQPLLRYIAYMAAVVACSVAISWMGEITYGLIRMGVRNKLFGHLLRLPAGYYDTADGNELVSRITTDCDSCSYYFEVVLTSFGAIYQAVVVFASLMDYNKQLGTYCLAIIPLTVAIAGIYGTMTFYIARLGVNTNAATTGYLFERTAAFRMIKAYNSQQREMTDGQRMFHKMFYADAFNEMTIAFIQLGMQLINVVTIVVTFIFGGKLVKEGQLSVGELIAFYNLSGMVGVQLINLFLNFGTFTSVNGSMKNVAQILMLAPEKTAGEPMGKQAQDLVFDHVDFAYDETSVLSDVSFRIPANQVTAIVGPNGAGKSTLMKLLERMYEPTQGRILYGDRDVSDYSLASWRDSMAVVSQNAPLISGTIRENMCYGTRPEAVKEETLNQVAKACGIYDYVCSQEEGFDSPVSVGSTNLSGGQRQALAIARAFLKDSPYLLLDEATRSLDAQNEQMINDAISELVKQRTTIMIAHNPSALRSVDYVIVMKQGTVEACGSKDELLKNNTFFRNMMAEVC